MNFEKRKITVDPKEALFEGVKIIGPLLASKGFTFHFRDEGSGSGGKFVWGEFARKDRRLELHFRHSLGLSFASSAVKNCKASSAESSPAGCHGRRSTTSSVA